MGVLKGFSSVDGGVFSVCAVPLTFCSVGISVCVEDEPSAASGVLDVCVTAGGEGAGGERGESGDVGALTGGCAGTETETVIAGDGDTDTLSLFSADNDDSGVSAGGGVLFRSCVSSSSRSLPSSLSPSPSVPSVLFGALACG